MAICGKGGRVEKRIRDGKKEAGCSREAKFGRGGSIGKRRQARGKGGMV
jgi:hypothetical protein